MNEYHVDVLAVFRNRIRDSEQLWELPGGADTQGREALATVEKLIMERDALLSACRLAQCDLNYVLRAHPEITGLAHRREAAAEIDATLARVGGGAA